MQKSHKEKLKYFIKRFVISSVDVGVIKRKKLTRHFLNTVGSTLDVGCGSGDFSIIACKKGGTVVGITLYPEDAGNCERYRDALGIKKDRLQFKALNVFDVLDLNQSFDQIICFEVIEHIKDDKKFISLLSNVLKPGGVIHICTPNLNGPDLLGDTIDTEEKGGHVRKGYTYEGLNKIITDAGLVILKKDAYGGFFTVKAIEVMRLAEKFMVNVFKRDIKAVKAVIFLCLYLFTFLDPLVACEPFSIYVMAGKPK